VLRQRIAKAKEAYRTLRDAYNALQDTHLDLQDDLSRQQIDHQRTTQRLTQERDTARSDLAFAESMARSWESIAKAVRFRAGTTDAATDGDTLDQTLKQLLVLAHPDKWSQGQPAAELAHELAVAINKVREQGRW
jgi:hypothetical protein